MTWSDLVSSVREKLRRGLGLGHGDAIQVAVQAPRLEQLGTAPLATPPAWVYENDREIPIHADVPGASPEGAVVAWEAERGRTLCLKKQAQPSGASWASEYPTHDGYRAFSLPDSVDELKATSSLKDGVLTSAFRSGPDPREVSRWNRSWISSICGGRSGPRWSSPSWPWLRRS